MEQTQIIQRINYKPYKLEIAVEYFLDCAKYIFGQKIEITKDFEYIMINLIKWIHNDETCDFDLNKGIGLIGPTGTRKTFAMNCMQEYMKIDDVRYYRLQKLVTFNFKMFSSREICGEYQENGYDAINKFSSYNIICIDDFGAEPEKTVHYGTTLNVIEALIEERYLAEKLTHFTSNLDENSIREKYGERVYSRLKQKINFIKLEDKDFRIAG